MSSIKSGLCWAIAILLCAVGNYFGLIDDKTAETLFIVLPAVAVTTLSRACACSLWRRNAEA